MSKKVSIAIVGAGMGGLTVAATLRAAGFDVRVYEQAKGFARVGAGIQMMPNSMKVLRRIGIEERLRRIAFEPYSHLNRVWDTGEITRELPMPESLFGAPYLCMHRADLHEALASVVPPEVIHFGKKLVGFEERRGQVTLAFEDGTYAQADAAIGADGVHSVVRGLLIGPDLPLHRGRIAYRAVFPAFLMGGRDIGRSRTKWWGVDRHIVIYYTRADRGEIYFVTSVPEPAEWLTRESWSAKGDVKELRAAYEGFHPDVRAVIEACPDCHKWAILEREPLPRWSDGRVVLLGDACHPMTPYMAQGAATAIEDAAVLTRHLAEVEGEDIQGAFTRYEADRKPRTSRIQAISSANTWMKGGSDDPAWLYGYDAWNTPPDGGTGRDGVIVMASSATDLIAHLEAVPFSRWHLRARIIVGSATFFDAFDALSLAFVLPVLVRRWGITPSQVGVLIAAGYLGQLVGALAFGALAERFGRIRSVAAAVAIMSVMSLACALTNSFSALLACRVIQGIGIGGEMPVAAVYINELSKALGRGRFFLLYELIFPIGLMMTGQIGALLVPRFGWQVMFLIGGVPGLAITALLWRLPESPRWLIAKGHLAEAEAVVKTIEASTDRRESPASSGRAVTRAVGPLYGSLQEFCTRSVCRSASRIAILARGARKSQQRSTSRERSGISRAAPRAAPLAGSGVGGRTRWIELLSPRYRARTTIVWILWAAAYFITNGLNNWMPTLYNSIYRLELQDSLRAATMTNVAQVAVLLGCAFSIDRVGRRRWTVVSFAIGAALLSILGLFGAQSVAAVMGLVTLSYGVIGAVNAVLYLYTPEIYPTRMRAIGTGSATCWLRLASAAGPLLVGYLIDAKDTRSIFLMFAGVGVVAAFAAAGMLETRNRRLEEIAP